MKSSKKSNLSIAPKEPEEIMAQERLAEEIGEDAAHVLAEDATARSNEEESRMTLEDMLLGSEAGDIEAKPVDAEAEERMKEEMRQQKEFQQNLFQQYAAQLNQAFLEMIIVFIFNDRFGIAPAHKAKLKRLLDDFSEKQIESMDKMARAEYAGLPEQLRGEYAPPEVIIGVYSQSMDHVKKHWVNHLKLEKSSIITVN